MPNEKYHEAASRSHKLLGLYLVYAAWTKYLDCVVLERDQLMLFLGLKTMQNKRIDWLTSDLKGMFLFSRPIKVAKTGVYSTLYLSREPLRKEPMSGVMSNTERVKALTNAGIMAAIIQIPKEDEIVRIMACLTHGVSPFQSDS